MSFRPLVDGTMAPGKAWKQIARLKPQSLVGDCSSKNPLPNRDSASPWLALLAWEAGWRFGTNPRAFAKVLTVTGHALIFPGGKDFDAIGFG